MPPLRDNPLVQKLLSLSLPSDDFAVMGGGCMFAAGLKDLNHDIDLIAVGSAWDKAQEFKPAQNIKSEIGQVVTLFDDQIEIFNKWGPGEWNLRKLIDEADINEGIRFVKLDEVLKWKKLINRPKDQDHIKLIENYLQVHG